jgi:hypothetical protein
VGVIEQKRAHSPAEEAARPKIAPLVGLVSFALSGLIQFEQRFALIVERGPGIRSGILFHGRPGTGKTLTVMYLATQMPDCTVFLTAGFDFGWLSQICQMARALQPALVVLEDQKIAAAPGAHHRCSTNC